MRFAALILGTMVLACCTRATDSTPIPAGSVDSRPLSGSGYKVLYRFKGGNDGETPNGPLLAFNGKLYGTTQLGGESNHGIVFSVSASGMERVLYSFKGFSDDGAYPVAGLTAVNGALYGTTQAGGSTNCGTIFSITTSGKKAALYRFGTGSDGCSPQSNLAVVNNTLYGLAYYGGTTGYGTVFGVTTSGKETLSYSFRGNVAEHPGGSLVAVNGSLYGTARSQPIRRGWGSIFKITTSGHEHELYRVKGLEYGSQPLALAAAGNTLYAGAYSGGDVKAQACAGGGDKGCGTILALPISGGPGHLLYTFQGAPNDGDNVAPGLLMVNGTLYGTTEFGGSGQCAISGGCGTAFSIGTSGTEQLLHNFQGGADGDLPLGGMTFLNGALYGTTSQGGTHNAGTVFTLAP